MQNQQDYTALSVACSAAIAAGDYFAYRLHAEKQVKTKSALSDLVTEVDPECERIIREAITTAFPDHDILGEESVPPGSEASAEAVDSVAEADHLWIVDPLDGTTNFVYGIPLSVVSIGYARKGQLTVGVIYDPFRKDLFVAQRGVGAYRMDLDEAKTWLAHPAGDIPGQRLHVSATTDLMHAVVASGFPTRTDMREETTRVGLMLTNRVKNLRALGTAALHLAYVAAANLDAFWEYDLNAWDLAAGVLIIQEAGGVVQDISGQPYSLRTRHIVCAGTPQLAGNLAVAIRVK